MPATPQQSEVIRIRESADADRSIVIHPENDDLFVRTGKQVIEACQLDMNLQVWLQEANLLMDDVKQWCSQHRDSVRACFVAPWKARLTLFFLPSTDHYQFDLGTELAELNTRLMQQYSVGMVETRQIPWNEWDRFVSPNTARLIYGVSPAAHRPVEA